MSDAEDRFGARLSDFGARLSDLREALREAIEVILAWAKAKEWLA